MAKRPLFCSDSGHACHNVMEHIGDRCGMHMPRSWVMWYLGGGSECLVIIEMTFGGDDHDELEDFPMSHFC